MKRPYNPKWEYQGEGEWRAPRPDGLFYEIIRAFDTSQECKWLLCESDGNGGSRTILKAQSNQVWHAKESARLDWEKRLGVVTYPRRRSL